MNQFKIISIDKSKYAYTDYWGLNGAAREIYFATVTIEIDARIWTKLKKDKQLGQLYGVDVSNEVYRLNNQINASCPSVDDSRRASKGIKRIILRYEMKQLPYKLKLLKGIAS